MSSSLIWEPVIEKDYKTLNCDIKFSLRKRYGDPISATLDHSDISYLEGLVDAGKKHIKEVIDLINKNGEIKIEETWL
jgi:hypothetical protein